MKVAMTRGAPVITLCALVAACSGGGSDGPQTAPLTLRVTDTPVDPSTIDRVCVQFSGVTVHYASEGDAVLPYAPLPAQVSAATHCVTGTWSGQGPPPPVRLDALGGALTVALAESLQVPVGRITWIRLHFTPGGSFIAETAGGQHDLRCPSCEVTDNNQGRGFKLHRTFEVPSSGIAVTVDIDLSKSLHLDGNGYVLRPTARAELDSTIGTIAGTVDARLIPDDREYIGGSVETGCAVYVYAGINATLADMTENGTLVTAARVRFDVTSGSYRFAAGALVDDEAGAEPYTVALTCNLDLDDPLTPNAAVVFGPPQNVDVNAGQTTTVAFNP